MATAANDVYSKRSTTGADGDRETAAAVQTQLSLVSSFEKWLARRVESDGNVKRIISRVERRLEGYRHWLLRIQQTPSHVLDGTARDDEPWAMDARIQDGHADRSVIVVTGPGADEPVEVVPGDQRELERLMSDDCLGYMIKICHAFAKAQDTLRMLLQTTSEVEHEESQLSEPAEATVKTYIRRLQEYNDMKDIGQQLIGLVAENRGVPIRTLYESGEFGVGVPP